MHALYFEVIQCKEFKSFKVTEKSQSYGSSETTYSSFAKNFVVRRKKATPIRQALT